MTKPTSPGENNGPNGQIILFGDSITENSFDGDMSFSFAASLSHAFRRRLDVINRGFSGYNTSHAVAVLPNFLPTPTQAKIDLMIICFGANDACLPHDPTDHHVPLNEFCLNLLSIIRDPKLMAHKPRVLLLTPPPIDEYQQVLADQARGFTPVRRLAENTGAYAEACRDVGAQLGIPVVDIWTAFLRQAGWRSKQQFLPGSREIPPNKVFQSFFTDGLHLTPSGYKIVYDEVIKSIKGNFPDLDPDDMPCRHPSWEHAPKRPVKTR